jgi:hypothetical protein
MPNPILLFCFAAAFALAAAVGCSTESRADSVEEMRVGQCPSETNIQRFLLEKLEDRLRCGHFHGRYAIEMCESNKCVAFYDNPRSSGRTFWDFAILYLTLVEAPEALSEKTSKRRALISEAIDRNKGRCKSKTRDAHFRCVILSLAANINVSYVTYDEGDRVDEPVDVSAVAPAAFDF